MTRRTEQLVAFERGTIVRPSSPSLPPGSTYGLFASLLSHYVAKIP